MGRLCMYTEDDTCLFHLLPLQFWKMLQGLRQHRWWTNHLSNRAVWLRGLATSHSITVNVGNRYVCTVRYEQGLGMPSVSMPLP